MTGSGSIMQLLFSPLRVSSHNPVCIIPTGRKIFNTTINNNAFIKLTDYARLFPPLLNHFNHWRLSSLRTRDILYDYYRISKKKDGEEKFRDGERRKQTEKYGNTFAWLSLSSDLLAGCALIGWESHMLDMLASDWLARISA